MNILIRQITYALLNFLSIFHANSDPSCSSEMPSSLSREVLYHDTREDSDFSFDVVEYAMIREVQAVRDLFGGPF